MHCNFINTKIKFEGIVIPDPQKNEKLNISFNGKIDENILQ